MSTNKRMDKLLTSNINESQNVLLNKSSSYIHTNESTYEVKGKTNLCHKNQNNGCLLVRNKRAWKMTGVGENGFG